MRILFLTALFLICFSLAAQAGEADDSKTKSAEAESRHFSFELGTGPGGLFSKGAKSAVLLLDFGAGYRFNRSWLLQAVYSSKMHPWYEARSVFQTVGPELRWTFWREMFAGVGGGVAWSFIKKGIYQQSKTGGGWFARLGYAYHLHPNVAAMGLLSLNQRYVGQLYTDFGFVIGVLSEF